MRKRTAAFVRTVTLPGKYGDQHGLILRVTPSGSKQWIWRGTIRGKRRDLGLGGYPYTSVAEARQRALEYRKLARQGGRPDGAAAQHHRAKLRRGVRAGDRDARTVLEGRRAVRGQLARLPAPRRHARRRDQRRPGVGHRRRPPPRRPDRGGDAGAAPQRPPDPTPPSTPSRRRRRALATVGASGAWAGTKLAFAFLVLTASRSGEVRGARWDQVDEGAALWTVPAERAKNARPHRVPLSAATLDVLAAAKRLPTSSGLIFPSANGRQISNATMGKLLRQNGIDAVPHGFRSSFRDWCGETGVAREVAEACIAHTVADATEAAYAQSDLLARRTAVMENWGCYITT